MRKAFNYIILAVLLFLFLFDSEVHAEESLNFNVSFDTVNRTLYRHEWKASEGDGYNIFVDSERQYTLSFESTILMDNIDGQDSTFLYDYIINNYPSITLTHNGSPYTRMYVEEIRMYLLINGVRYEVPSSATALYHAAGCNKIGVIVEADIHAYTMYHTDLADVAISAKCSNVSGQIRKSSFSAYGLLADIRNSNMNLLVWQDNIHKLLTSVGNNIAVKLDTLHTDNEALYNVVISWLELACNKLDEIRTWLQWTNENINIFKDTAVSWYEKIHSMLNAINANVSSGFYSLQMQLNAWKNDLNTKLTAWFDRQHQDMLDLGEKLTHGFDASDGDTVIGDIDDTMGGLSDAQDSLIDSSFEDLDDYTINENGIGGMLEQYAKGISLVSAMTQSFYESMGEFGYTIAVGFTCIIACMCIGLFRFRGK